MDSVEWNEGFKRCPAIVQEYLLEAASGENEDRAQELLAVDNDGWDRISDPVWALIFDGMNKQEFHEEVKKVAGDHKPEEVERILLQYIAYPLADMISWDVDARLQELGVPAVDLQSMFRISLRPMSYGAAARRIAINAKLSILTEEVARRLREILISYLKDVRTLDQVKVALQQTQLEGGVGFSAEQADRYVEELEKLQIAVKILSEQDFAEWYANFQREATIQQLSEPGPGQKKTEDGLLVVRANSTDDAYDQLLETTIDETLKQLSVVGLDDYLLKRLRNIISSRLRDVRNAIQIKEVLTRDSKIGGLDRHPEEAEAMVKVIEAAYLTHHTELSTLEQQRIERMKQAQNEKREMRRKEDSEAHAEWYRNKVQESNPWANALEAQKSGQPLAASNQAAWPPAATGQQPALDAIRAPVRLTSLGSELGGITLAEFRRISKSPEEAMERLWQKLETLKQESYDHWQEGAQAWRQSPLQQQYLQMVTQSFTSGRPVAEIAREMHEKDPNQPTAEEIGAILLINNRLNV
jgi:hypothetical protein